MLLTLVLCYFYQNIVIPAFGGPGIDYSCMQDTTIRWSFVDRKFIHSQCELQNEKRIMKMDLLFSTILATFCAESLSSKIY